MRVFSFFKNHSGLPRLGPLRLSEASKVGFTLIEMIVVVAIVTLLSSIVIANINTGDRGIQVRRSTQIIFSALREAQNNALGSKRAGVYFVLSENPILFIDINSDEMYNVGEEVRTIALDVDVSISSLLPSNPLHIFFSPPNPDVYINGSPIAEDALIIIQSLADASVTRTVRINMLGLVTSE